MTISVREFKLPSDAILKIRLAPFADAKALYQAILKEVKSIHIDSSDAENMLKNLLCVGLSSLEIEKAIEKCMSYCQYNDGRGDLKIDKDTFEAVEARADYLAVCLEVATDNVMPFMKSLFAQFPQLSVQVTKGSQA